MLACYSNAFKCLVNSIEFERDGDGASRNISQYNSTRPIGAEGAESFKSNSSDFNILKKKETSEFKMSSESKLSEYEKN